MVVPGPLGDLQRLQLAGPLSRQPLTEDDVKRVVGSGWRSRPASSFAEPAAGLMPYTSREIQTLRRQFPASCLLIHDFADHCDPELKLRLDGPAGYLNPSVESAVAPTESVAEVNPALPLLCQRRGEEAMALVSGAENLRKAKALITLHGLAPDDAETLEELSGLRQVLAQLWMDVDAAGLEALYGTAVDSSPPAHWRWFWLCFGGWR